MSPAIDVDRGTYNLPSSPVIALAFHKLGFITQERKTLTMTKTLDVITEIIRNPKHPFRKVDDRPVKAQKHRYERRKVKEFIRLGDWAQDRMIV